MLSTLYSLAFSSTRRKHLSRTARLSFVVSEVHGWVNFAEWKEEKPMKVVSDQSRTKMGEQYPLSKLLEVLLVQELAGRVRRSEVIINMMNPAGQRGLDLERYAEGRQAREKLWAELSSILEGVDPGVMQNV
ncbi:uncharacterized protein N7479_003847 [Penicillium vulpinum]|uniref:uncharacterized protein n=1 Tax=Penicillium vulpinum TaxID=29845 RepID=UPI00254885A6|nr:uncharacterized protein N7479_003847 [Penicillium vulpinum]KAJ5963971.1 hypothetical protein N7479_003847 [Penicillium vulpinum]